MRQPAIAAVAALLAASAIAEPAHAGAPASPSRLLTLPAACQGGGNAGAACQSDAECPRGRCRLLHVPEIRKPILMRVTLVVDDDVSAWDGSESLSNVVAVTALVEVRHNRRKFVFANTYQNLDGTSLGALVDGLTSGVPIADLAGSNRVLSEAILNAAAADGSILDDLLFQEPDSEIADALRGLFETTGRPVIVNVPARRGYVVHTDEGATRLASTVQLFAWVRFVPES